MKPPLGGFTLIELLTVCLIIGILAVMLMGTLSGIRARLEKTHCISNLRNLYVGANGYLQQNQHWPQISTALVQKQPREYAKQWIEALQPFGIDQQVWICKTVQKLLQGPDLKDPKNIRVDYVAMPFDSKQYTPHRWPHQPWFVERAAVHGNGNLLIYTDGSVVEANDVIRSMH